MSHSTTPEEAIFLAALEKSGRQEREAYVAAECGGDKALLARVKELLAAHDGDSGPLDATLPGLQAGSTRDGVERPGTQIGPYKLLQVIGEGGMGVVYMASQREPVERRVALKIIKPGMDSRQVIARFEAERQALALMDHPNIARVLDGGTTGEGPRDSGLGTRGSDINKRVSAPSPQLLAPTGRPYFVMELVKGVPITQYCDEHHLTPRQRLELFVPVCQAIQHAHHKGIIHRDIKPSNILVAEYDQQPVPKIIDFGVAKAIGQRLTEKTMFTEFGQVVGTIEYMSPEQAKLNQLDIDTRTDVYSLGVLLYELLSGETPFDRERLRSAAFDEVLRIIREEEPPRPSTKLSSSHSLPSIAASRHTEPRQLTSLLRGELDWIVMKALEKDRNRRYETASGLALDLMRYLHDEPVLACPPSAGYRIGKFARRNKRTLVTAALFSVLLFTAIVAVASIGGWALRDRDAQRTAAAQRIALDRAERRIVLEREIEAALGEVALAYSHDRLADAIATQKRAASLWTSGASDPDLKRRIDQWRADLQLAQRLDEIRLEQAAVKDGHFDRGAAEPAYLESFQQYGLDFEQQPEAAIANRIRSSAIRDRLLPALDDWLDARLLAKLPGAPKLVAVAALADDDPWRNRLRQTSLNRNPPTLLTLAQEADVLDHPASSLLLLASLLRGTDQMPAAISLLEQAQQQYPVDFWINQNLAYYLMQLSNPPIEKAIGYYRAAITLRPTSPGVHINLGNALRRLNRTAAAEREFRAAVELKPDYAEAHLNLGGVLFDQGLLEDAEKEFLAALEHRTNYVKALSNLGKVYHDLDRLVEAEFCSRSATSLDPDDLFSQKVFGDVLLKLDRHVEAEAAYREVIRLDSRVARYHQDLGTVLRLQGRMTEAADEFLVALRLEPASSQSKSDLATVQQAARTPAEIEAQHRAAVVRQPDNAAMHLQLADFLQAQGNTASAEAEYREALRLVPDLAAARFKLVPLLGNQGRFAEMEALFQQLLKARPSETAIHLEFGGFLLGQGRRSDGEREFRSALELDPKKAAPHWHLAKLLMSQNKSADALVEFQTAIRCEPTQPVAHYEYALALVQLGRHSEAAAACREAVRFAPRDSRMHHTLAEQLAKSGLAAEAEVEFREAIRLSTPYTDFRRSYGEFLAAQNRLTEAEEELRRLLRLVPSNLTARKCLIDVLLKQDRRDEAITVYRDAILQQPHEQQRYWDLADFLEREARLSEAEQVLRDAVAALPESIAARDRLALFLTIRKNSVGAPEELQELIRRNPKDASLHFRLAGALRQQRRLADAMTAVREAIRLNGREVSYYYFLADAALAQGQSDEEISALRQLLAARPGEIGASMRLAACLLKQSKPGEMEQTYRDAIRQNPNNIILYVNLGLALVGQGRGREAVAALRELVVQAPDDPGAHLALAQMLSNVQQYQASIEACRRALEINPDFHVARSHLARMLDADGKLAEAIAACRQAASGLPTDPSVQYQLGNLLLRHGDYLEAEQVLVEAQKLRPADIPTKNDLATVRQRIQLSANEESLRAAVKQSPGDAIAHAKLGSLLLTLTRNADAEIEFREAVRLAPDSVGHRESLASALNRQMKLAEEEVQRRELVRLQPQSAPAQSMLGQVQARQAKWPAAAETFAKFVELDPQNHWGWYCLTVLRLETGDVDGYRLASRAMLDRFENDKLPEICERTAKTCLLSSEEAGLRERALVLSERAATGTETHFLFWYFQLTRGLAYYREEKNAEALVWLERFHSRVQPAGPAVTPFVPFYAAGHALLAVTQHRLEHPSEAAASLQRAQEQLTQFMPDGTPGRYFENDWGDWLRARMLVREAERVLAKNSPATAASK